MNFLNYTYSSYENSSFFMKNDDMQGFQNKTYKEFKVTLILEGEGEFIVLDRVVPFKKGDVFLFGVNAPNVLFNSKKKNEAIDCSGLKTVSLLFNQDKIECSLEHVNEAYRIKKLLSQIDYGVKVSKGCSRDLGGCLKELGISKGVKRILLSLRMLHLVSKDSDAEYISSIASPKNPDYEVNSKISLVYAFVKENFHKKISLNDVAEIASMSPTAFCRFFKAKSDKTFSQYLIEIRIGNACMLLDNENMTVEGACYSSGYNSLSNFHKHFKRMMRMSPFEYRTNILNI
ncbi:AraC-type DNA-binding protein [Algibacter lectus]|uniref:AraC family transcriptional regulator n=1 Tax=Algibacter lectus TaxID=221126 RepID=UPI0008EAB051|nr:AraC family transcriptional regulator [Algibacter lectus]SFB86994.1 AraC-type DNA-binding protein [Algibacter lectus]